MPSVRGHRASESFASGLAGRTLRAGLVALGALIVVLGVLIAPLPGPGGLPVILVGLMIILRNSFKARRQFVRLQQAHPRVLSPVRRLLRRNPGVLRASWRQTLKIERMFLPSNLRFAARSRRYFRPR
jgi:Flp pilus assembly protein TadB